MNVYRILSRQIILLEQDSGMKFTLYAYEDRVVIPGLLWQASLLPADSSDPGLPSVDTYPLALTENLPTDPPLDRVEPPIRV